MSSMLVRHEPASAAVVRHRLVRELRRRRIPAECVDEVALVASELFGNAVRHTVAPASGRIEVSWDVDASGVTITVVDASTAYPHPRAPRADEAGGRGLTIVAALSDNWGVQPLGDGGGKRVWAHLPLQAVDSAR